jgi:hypothetical protein
VTAAAKSESMDDLQKKVALETKGVAEADKT